MNLFFLTECGEDNMMAAIMTALNLDTDELALLIQYTVTPARLAMEEHMKTYASKHAGPVVNYPQADTPINVLYRKIVAAYEASASQGLAV